MQDFNESPQISRDDLMQALENVESWLERQLHVASHPFILGIAKKWHNRIGNGGAKEIPELRQMVVECWTDVRRVIDQGLARTL